MLKLKLQIEFEKRLDQELVVYSHLAKKMSEVFVTIYSDSISHDTISKEFELILAPQLGYCDPLVNELILIAVSVFKGHVN